MHVATLHGRGRLGEAYTQGVDFACNTSICYGIGASRHSRFIQLQNAINDKARSFGYRGTFLVADGKIGAATVTLVSWVADKMAAAGYMGGANWPKMRTSARPTKVTVASLADELLNELTQGGVIVVNVPPVTVPPIAPTTLPPFEFPTPTTVPPTSRLPPTAGNPPPRPPSSAPPTLVSSSGGPSNLAYGLAAAGAVAVIVVGVAVGRSSKGKGGKAPLQGTRRSRSRSRSRR